MEGDVFRNVRMSPEFMEQFVSRTDTGQCVVWNWGEPGADGFYMPTVVVVDDGKVLIDRKSLDEVAACVRGLREAMA
jgi:hypothetical protein